jgi:predicted phage terminase large subunit-like protein
VHRIVAAQLMRVLRGEVRRLIINIPPRHGKSELCSIRYPVFHLSKNPHTNTILACYAANLSTIFGRKARNVVSSLAYQRLFPGVHLARDVGTSGTHWALTNGSEFVASGLRGGITGKGADVIVVDDPYKDREQANSPRIREAVKDWYKDVVLTRLTYAGAVVIPMTRWHYDDLCGWLVREFPEQHYTVVSLPALMDQEPSELDPRHEGEALWPERFGVEMLRQRREEMGPISFNCLYQQRPTLGEQAILRVEWLVRDFQLPVERDLFERVVISWDTSFGAEDYSVGLVLGERQGNIYLLDLVRGRWNFPNIMKRASALHEKWNSDAVIVEQASSGHDVIAEFRQSSDMPIMGIKPHNSKEERAKAVSGRLEAGRVHVPSNAPWLADLFTELEQFPSGEHDDQVDALTQGVRYITKYAGYEEPLKEETACSTG